MSLSQRPWVVFAIVAVLCVALLLGAQALASASAPTGGIATTGRVLGQTGYAYLGGLRTFAAALLWNRLDPIFHGYYHESFDKDFAVFMPDISLVLALDPQFQQAYYVASYFLASNGHLDTGVSLAKEAVANNPKSGLLRANLIEILRMQDPKKNLPEIVKQTQIGVQPDMTYANIDDAYESLGVFRSVYMETHDTAMAARLREVQKQLAAQGATPSNTEGLSHMGLSATTK